MKKPPTIKEEWFFKLMPIDEPLDSSVVPMVEFLRGLGLNTWMSCGGHRQDEIGSSGSKNNSTAHGRFYVIFSGTAIMSVGQFVDYFERKRKELGEDPALDIKTWDLGWWKFYGTHKGFYRLFGDDIKA